MAQGTRRQRVGNAMRAALTELIAREVKDPRVHGAGLVTVNQVELNRDLSVAFVYVSFIGAPDTGAEERALRGLEAAAAFLRGPAGRRLQLQRAPELRFSLDPRGAFGEQMRELLSDDQARAAVRDESDEASAEVVAVAGELLARSPERDPAS